VVVSVALLAGSVSLGVFSGLSLTEALEKSGDSAHGMVYGLLAGVTAFVAGMAGRWWAVARLYDFLFGRK
jgi:hypothetical protein